MARSISVVVSQGQSHNPAKRRLEEGIVGSLLGESGIDVTIVPHLYDLAPDGSGMLCLEGITGDMVICSWLYPRAAHWILDRNGIHGHVGETLIKVAGEDDEDEEDEVDAEEKARVVDEREIPNRKVYCLDLRASDSIDEYVEEIRRIAREATTQTVELGGWIGGSPKPEQMARFLEPAPGNVESNGAASNGAPSNGAAATNGEAHASNGHASSPGGEADNAAPTPNVVEEEAGRRWYPVIDFGRCTNCLECIDFCLFGVYGIDQAETILVEQPDNCRKGCPACSRVCPENAIIFPQHKTPAIAGSSDVAAAMKIDLSKLFGAPGADAVDMAVRERDEQLAVVGRNMVGHEVGLDKAQERKRAEERDELDDLIDKLDELDL